MDSEWMCTSETREWVRRNTGLDLPVRELQRWGSEGRGPCVHRVIGRYYSTSSTRENFQEQVLSRIERRQISTKRELLASSTETSGGTDAS